MDNIVQRGVRPTLISGDIKIEKISREGGFISQVITVSKNVA